MRMSVEAEIIWLRLLLQVNREQALIDQSATIRGAN